MDWSCQQGQSDARLTLDQASSRLDADQWPERSSDWPRAGTSTLSGGDRARRRGTLRSESSEADYASVPYQKTADDQFERLRLNSGRYENAPPR
jgi:hypothetical protein